MVHTMLSARRKTLLTQTSTKLGHDRNRNWGRLIVTTFNVKLSISVDIDPTACEITSASPCCIVSVILKIFILFTLWVECYIEKRVIRKMVLPKYLETDIFCKNWMSTFPKRLSTNCVVSSFFVFKLWSMGLTMVQLPQFNRCLNYLTILSLFCIDTCQLSVHRLTWPTNSARIVVELTWNLAPSLPELQHSRTIQLEINWQCLLIPIWNSGPGELGWHSRCSNFLVNVRLQVLAWSWSVAS